MSAKASLAYVEEYVAEDEPLLAARASASEVGGASPISPAGGAALRFIAEAHPGVIVTADYPALSAHAAKLEAMPVFQTISQKFIPPA